MLKDTLFTITLLDQHENTIDATLEINENCGIFKGHFPGQPVLPGASMLQIIKEVLESAFNICFRLKKADYIKFLGIIDPQVSNLLQLKLFCRPPENKTMFVTADLIARNEICFKFRGTFIAR